MHHDPSSIVPNQSISMSTDNIGMGIVAVIGGTGDLGGGVARRLARDGARVIIGSRDADRAALAARTLSTDIATDVSGTDNVTAATIADIVLVAVPFASQAATLTELAPVVRGKILIDATVPLVPPRVSRVQLPAEGSAAARGQAILGPDVRYVSAFHNVSAAKLAADGPIECDVLVFSDDQAARQTAIDLAAKCGLRGLHGGVLANSAAAEALTSVLIFLNRTYSIEGGAGIRITGIDSGTKPPASPPARGSAARQ
jgi:8-hydroxy-5-deazaflavin:NADPH oxidoreductase